MNQDTLRLIDSIAKERNIERDILIRDLEQAMISAARKHFNSLDVEEFGCRMDPISGEITMWRNHFPDEDEENGDGKIEREPIPLESLGRIPAQTAKQVMIQRFREEERVSLLEDFSKRKGELATGTAQRYEGGALVVQIDRGEGFMPRSEQIPGEQFHAGDRVRCLILDVRESGSQVKIVLSRADSAFISNLFHTEVPEVAEHIIEIKAMAREPGFRTKLAVSSSDSRVDPVGACVGVRGSRIRNIVDELGGEKIDIVRWNESSQVLIANALKPAEIEDVSLCFELGRGTVIVCEDQLSLAIGRRGQNVRLAARLTGWDLDILTPAEYAKGLEILQQTLEPLDGVDDSALDRMAALGMISVFDVEEVGAEVLVTELEIDPDVASLMVETCGVQAKVVAEQQQREKAEAERLRAEEEAAGASILDAGEGGEVDESSDSVARSILGLGDEPHADEATAGKTATEPPAESADDASEETSSKEPADDTSEETPAEESVDANEAGMPAEGSADADATGEPAADAPSVEDAGDETVETPVEEAADDEAVEEPSEEAADDETAEAPAVEDADDETVETPVEEAADDEAAEAPAEEVAGAEETDAPADESADTEESAAEQADAAPVKESAVEPEDDASEAAPAEESADAEEADSDAVGDVSAEEPPGTPVENEATAEPVEGTG